MNSLQYRSRFHKNDVVKQAMRKLLEENPEGIDSSEFRRKIIKRTGVSPGMIFDLVKEFHSVGLMGSRKDTTDRRKVIYLPNIANMKKESNLYEGVEFIRSLGDDVRFAEAATKTREYHCRVSLFSDQKEVSKEELEKTAQAMSESNSLMFKTRAKLERLKMKPSFKLAYVVTFEKF